MTWHNLISLLGILALMALAWALSRHRRKLNVRVIAWGVGIQLALAALVFQAPGRVQAFQQVNDVVGSVLDAAQEGPKFLFGPLAEEAMVRKIVADDAAPGSGFVLVTMALPLIIFFSAAMAILYYFGVMQAIIRAFAYVFTTLMRISGAESLCAASNIFVGIESATTVRPYLKDMTQSEFCTILTAGMATVASTTLGIYVMMLSGVFEGIAAHLISASLLSAPAAVVMSKILLPETGQPLTRGKRIKLEYQRESGVMEAVINGAMAGLKLLVGVCALLIAFLGLIAVVDLILAPVGEGCEWAVNGIGQATGWWGSVDLQWSLQGLAGLIMWPLAVVMGVPVEDASQVGQLLGLRALATEIPAYQQLSTAARSGAMQPRSVVITAYALCGFAHVASLAIFVGGLAALVPERRKDLAAVGPRALLAATLACLMTGAVAGTFYSKDSLLLRQPPPKTRPATIPATIATSPPRSRLASHPQDGLGRSALLDSQPTRPTPAPLPASSPTASPPGSSPAPCGS